MLMAYLCFPLSVVVGILIMSNQGRMMKFHKIWMPALLKLVEAYGLEHVQFGVNSKSFHH